MKKIVSLILAGLMSVSLFAIGASADTIAHDTKTTVVGAGTGAENFDDRSDNSDINVKVEKVVHMYAVDLTFNFSDLTVGNITWDVNDLKYKSDKELTDDTTTQTITISNRSDLSVWTRVEVADTPSDYVTVTADSLTGETYSEIVKATATVGTTKGEATSKTVTITLHGDSWDNFVEYYGNKFATEGKTSYVLATVTVYLSAKSNATTGN